MRKSKSFWIIFIISSLYLWSAAYMLGNLWAFKKNTELFMEQQHELNASVTRVMAKMAAAIEHNYDFNKSNKDFIQRVAEIYVPDEVALLRTIPARQ